MRSGHSPRCTGIVNVKVDSLPRVLSGAEGGLDVSGELGEDRVGLLLDDGLTELADLAEDGEVGLDLQARPTIARRQRKAHPCSNPAAQSLVAGFGAHARTPGDGILLLHGHRAPERKPDGADLDFEAPSVRACLHRFDAFDTRNAARYAGYVHQEVPQALALHGDHALLREGQR